MSIIYLDLSMGAAGDMLSASLYELLDEKEKENYINKINSIGLEGVLVSPEETFKCGIKGTHMKVEISGKEEDEHEHEHHHHHFHRKLSDIEEIILKLNTSDKVKKDILAVYKHIAEAEAKAHGKPVSDIHFHEVGTLDAICDIASVSILLEMLGADEVKASPVHAGSGHVHCAHGILPVPAPATAHILEGIPFYGGEIKGELCTPTGAALLKHFVSSFGDMPVMKVKKTGYGMGKKDFERANTLRSFLGESAYKSETVYEYSFNIDDMTAERTAFAVERIFEAGALEVYTVPCGMKKSRPGLVVYAMCIESRKEEVIKAIFKYTTTLGIRENTSRRYTLSRNIEEIKTELGSVRVKKAKGYGVLKQKLEYEDIAKLAREYDLSIEEVEKKVNENRKDMEK